MGSPSTQARAPRWKRLTLRCTRIANGRVVRRCPRSISPPFQPVRVRAIHPLSMLLARPVREAASVMRAVSGLRRQSDDLAARRLVQPAPLAQPRGRICIRARRRIETRRGRRSRRCFALGIVRRFQRHRQWPSPDQPVFGDGLYLEVGSRKPKDLTACSDIDMMSANADGRFVHKDGTPYP